MILLIVLSSTFILASAILFFYRAIEKQGAGTFFRKLSPHPKTLVKFSIKNKNLKNNISKLDKNYFKFTFSQILIYKQVIVNFLKMILSVASLYQIYSYFYQPVSLKLITLIYLFSISIMLFYLPDLYIRNLIKKRKKLFRRSFPIFLDTLSLFLKTGMNLEKSLNYFSQKFKGVISDEVKKILIDFKYGNSLEHSLSKASSRIKIQDFEEFYNSFIQSQKLGVPISHTLSVQSGLLRTRMKQRAEEASHKASVKIAIPLVFCIFPALLIIYLVPAILRFYSSSI